MTPLAILFYALPLVAGALLVHLLWPDRRPSSIVFKLFLGAGLGLGLHSLLYFVHLLIFADGGGFLVGELAAVVVLGTLVLWRRRTIGPAQKLSGFVLPTPAQWVLATVAALVLIVSLLSTASFLLRRRQGSWDAWMMYNRTARFVHLDQAHWLESFSAEMDPIFHADYPLLLAMNIAAGWDVLGRESPAIPMIQSALFAFGCIGLATSALATIRTPGQAALGLIVLWGIPTFVIEGARQMADVPMAFFILAAGALLFLYVLHRDWGLLTLAGISTGLAAWTKNEGTVLIFAVSAAVLVVSDRRYLARALLTYAAGLALPLAIVLYFKFLLAPPGDLLSVGVGGWISQAGDVSRHALILQTVWRQFLEFGSWGIQGLSIGILPILLIYFLLFRAPLRPGQRPAYAAVSVLLLVQIIGYYAAYLISPYPLAWHLSYSSTRIVLQVFPLILFLVLGASINAEEIFAPGPLRNHGAKHAASH
jgi:hypothetical protein